MHADFASDEDKARGGQLLNDIILSYQRLDGQLEAALESGGGAAGGEAAGRAMAQLKTTLQLAYDMEAFVRQVLTVA